MLIDLHVHTSDYSPCSVVSPDEVMQAAIGRKLAGVVLTEHDYLWPQGRVSQLQDKYPRVKIYRGMEVTSGNGDHFLVYGVADFSWIYFGIAIDTLITRVRKQGGAIIYAHPYRFRQTIPREVIDNPPHALELRSSNIAPRLHNRIKTLATLLEIPLTAASDAHSIFKVGCHATRFPHLPQDEQELAQFIRDGEFEIPK